MEDAKNQYKFDRLLKDAKTRMEEPLLKFKRGALVHFAVSTDEVYMATRGLIPSIQRLHLFYLAGGLNFGDSVLPAGADLPK